MSTDGIQDGWRKALDCWLRTGDESGLVDELCRCRAEHREKLLGCIGSSWLRSQLLALVARRGDTVAA